MKLPKIITLTVFVQILFGLNIYSQQPTEEWVRTYNSPDNTADHFTDIVKDNFGNIYLTGWGATQTQENNISTIKYNNSGVLQWAVSYNGSGNTGDLFDVGENNLPAAVRPTFGVKSPP